MSEIVKCLLSSQLSPKCSQLAQTGSHLTHTGRQLTYTCSQLTHTGSQLTQIVSFQRKKTWSFEKALYGYMLR